MKYNVIKIVRAVKIIEEKPFLEGKHENWIHGLDLKFGYENWKRILDYFQSMAFENLV